MGGDQSNSYALFDSLATVLYLSSFVPRNEIPLICYLLSP
jgi:hypothetical protein